MRDGDGITEEKAVYISFLGIRKQFPEFLLKGLWVGVGEKEPGKVTLSHLVTGIRDLRLRRVELRNRVHSGSLWFDLRPFLLFVSVITGCLSHSY